jgi:hypothetical protein
MRSAARSAAAVQVLSALAVGAVVGLLATLLWVAHRDDPSPARSPGEPVQVGLVSGESVPAYLRASRHQLAALTAPSGPSAGDTWALVSLSAYASPGRLPVLLAGAAVAQAYARVPLPGVQTQVVRLPVFRLPGDVTAGMLDAALQRDQDQAQYLRLSRAVKGDGGDAGRARQAYEVEAATAAAEAAAYRSGCACVFGAVIRAAPAVLQQIANLAGVRAVDPAPEVRSLDETEFRPLRPEQLGTADDPTESVSPGLVPSRPASIASRAVAPLLSSLGVPVTSASAAGSGTVEADPS